MKKITEYSNLCDFQKNSPKDKIYWTCDPDVIGEHLFSFDKVTIFNLFEDYPHNLTKEQKCIFDNENPYWRDFFSVD